jgi:tRNA (cmo5U34)-methyltransferase
LRASTTVRWRWRAALHGSNSQDGTGIRHLHRLAACSSVCRICRVPPDARIFENASKWRTWNKHMQPEELRAAFDQQATGYDQQWTKLAPIRDGLYFLLESVFAPLPAEARILCVGAGTGIELVHLARKFPRFRFTAVEPSGAMMAVCRQRAEAEGFVERCRFHVGYVDTLRTDEPHEGATCFLVSQFIVDRESRVGLFRSIAQRLAPGGVLASSDLSSKVGSPEHRALVAAWMNMMAAAEVPAENLRKMEAAWEKDVAILPPTEVVNIIAAGGFEAPTQFYQAGLIHAWFARRGEPPN